MHPSASEDFANLAILICDGEKTRFGTAFRLTVLQLKIEEPIKIGHGKTLVRSLVGSSKFIPRSNNHKRTMSTEQPTEDVTFQESEKAGIIILNRPKDLNAINLVMIHTITRQIEEFEKFKSLIIVKSAVPKVFSAGGDVVRMTEMAKNKDPTIMYSNRYGYRLVHTVATAKIPYVALLDGVVMGAGAGLSVVGKYRFCTENTDFAMPEARVGLFGDVGSSFYMSRLKNNLGFYLALTGTKVKGYNNVVIGTGTHYCESAKLPELETALGTTNDIEGTINSFNSKPENWKFDLEPYIEKIDRIFSSQSVEEIIAKLEEDGSPWAKKTVGTLRYVCPFSLKATLHNLHLSRNLTLEECLQNEYVLAHTFFRGENFIEGVRAFLKDRDNKPKWNPPRLEDVTPQMIEDLYKVKPFLGPIELRPEIRGKL